MFKELLNIALTLSFLGSGLHFDLPSHQNNSKGYSFCKAGCNNKSCLTYTHECQECLNESSRLVVLNSSSSLRKETKASVVFSNYIIKNKFLLTGLSARSPPQIL